MKAQDIKNKMTLLEYLKYFDPENLDKYLTIIEYFEKNTIHDIYKICSYIFKNIETKNIIIKNKINYFKLSLNNNINKLNNYQKNLRKNEKLPYWFDKEIKQEITTDEEIKEIEDLFNEI